jgi:aryl-alcohol dehydrogenase-like predicted oxidoreductase
MAMRYRPFGKTGLSVSEIGFGCWGIGGTPGDARGYGPTDDAESRRALLQAFDLGITFYDTAPLYGYGHSEELVGQAFAAHRKNIIISTKVGYRDFSGVQDFSPNYIRSSLDASLKRLNTDYIDIYQLHDPSMAELLEHGEIVETLHACKREGKIRCAGISTRSPADSVVAVEQLGFQSVQVNFSLVDQRAVATTLFERCRALGAGIIARTPLCFGFLTGRYGAGDPFAPGDHRGSWKPEQIACWAEAYKLFTSGLVRHEEQTHAQIALRYILSFNDVSTTIPGMLNVAQVIENAQASGLGPFPAEVVQQFAAIYRQNRFWV